MPPCPPKKRHAQTHKTFFSFSIFQNKRLRNNRKGGYLFFGAVSKGEGRDEVIPSISAFLFKLNVKLTSAKICGEVKG
jgi:hypothetical protein